MCILSDRIEFRGEVNIITVLSTICVNVKKIYLLYTLFSISREMIVTDKKLQFISPLEWHMYPFVVVSHSIILKLKLLKKILLTTNHWPFQILFNSLCSDYKSQNSCSFLLSIFVKWSCFRNSNNWFLDLCI